MTARILAERYALTKTVVAYEEDLTTMTKAQIKELGGSIGVSLNTSSTKDTMISTLKATEEYGERLDVIKRQMLSEGLSGIQ